MQEGDALAFGAEAGLWVDEDETRRPATGEGVVKVADGEAEVMYAWAALVDELRDGSTGDRRFEKFDQRVAGEEPGDSGTVGVGEFRVVESEDVVEEGPEFGGGAHGEAHVGDGGFSAGAGR